MSQFGICEPFCYSGIFGCFGKTDLVTVWSEKAQMATHSSVRHKPVLFLFSRKGFWTNEIQQNIPESDLCFWCLFGIRIKTALSRVDRIKPPPREGFSPDDFLFWVVSKPKERMIHNPEKEDPSWKATPKIDQSWGLFFRGIPLSPGCCFGNNPTKNPPPHGGALTIKVVEIFEIAPFFFHSVFPINCRSPWSRCQCRCRSRCRSSCSFPPPHFPRLLGSLSEIWESYDLSYHLPSWWGYPFN